MGQLPGISGGSLKRRIRDFDIKYGHRLNLDRTKVAKSLEDKLSRAVDEGHSKTVDLARQDLEREASERYKGFVIRSRLKRVPNESVKYNAFAREEEVRRFPFRYIESVKSPGAHVLQSNREMRDAFLAHFRDCFARCPDRFGSFVAI